MTYVIKKIQKYPAFWLISQFELSFKKNTYTVMSDMSDYSPNKNY